MAERENGTWASDQVGLIVPRQNGKGSVLEALELAHLFLIDSTKLIIHSAHEFATSAEHFRRLLTLIESSADLDRMVQRVLRSHGSEGIELRDGSRILFKTRTGGGGRGFSGDLIVLDEAYNLADKAISSLMPTMSAMPNPQIWVTSSAPIDDDPRSNALRRFCRGGRKGVGRRCYIEYGCAAGASNSDRRAWAKANPGYPHRISEEAIEGELSMMDPGDFARERLGVWHEQDHASEQVIPEGAWRACESPDSRRAEGAVRSFAVDVSPMGEAATIAWCATSTLGGVHAEVVDRLPSADAAVERLKSIHARGGFTELIIAKGSPAAAIVPELGDIPVRLIATEEHSLACTGLLSAVLAGRVHHLGDELLDAAVRNAAQRSHGDGWLWSRRKSSVDITALVAVTLAHWCVVSPSEPLKPLFAY